MSLDPVKFELTPCVDCDEKVGFKEQSPAYAYPDGWRCQKHRDEFEKELKRAIHNRG